MTRNSLALCLVTAAALAGCHKQTIVAGGDPVDATDANVTTNAPVALPPTIVASKIFRCADNKVIYVDYLSDGKSANIRTDQDGTPTQVTAPEAGKDMTAAGGYSLSGEADTKSAKIAVPGHPSQSCNANK